MFFWFKFAKNAIHSRYIVAQKTAQSEKPNKQQKQQQMFGILEYFRSVALTFSIFECCHN